MKVGDLVRVISIDQTSIWGIGMYLGYGQRGTTSNTIYEAFLWKGRIATFDRKFWNFKVISGESR